jgi:hypothetical protein
VRSTAKRTILRKVEFSSGTKSRMEMFCLGKVCHGALHYSRSAITVGADNTFTRRSVFNVRLHRSSFEDKIPVHRM